MPATNYLRLSELAEQIENVINGSFYQASFWVMADVIDYKVYEQKGHHYFSLAEKSPGTHSLIARIAAVAWKSGGAVSITSFEQLTGQKFGNNIQILANVSVQYSSVYGLKLILNEVDPTFTIGLLEQHRRDTLQKLITLCPDYVRLVDGVYKTRNNSLELAPVLQHIAVITSSEAEGYRDFKHTIEQNSFGYAVRLDTWFTSVQGEANAQGVLKQLVDIYQSGHAYDAVVIIRGGGSQADLLLFEQFNLARAVAKFPIPIIAGIGHHINQSIVDMMAHTTVKTPSIAAAFIIAHNRRFEESVLFMQGRILIKTQQVIARQHAVLSLLRSSVSSTARSLLNSHQSSLNNIVAKLVVRPKMITASRQHALDNIVHNLKAAASRYLRQQQRIVDRHLSISKALDPVNILKRGFAVIYSGGEIVTNAEHIDASDKISIRFHRSIVSATVTSKTNLDESVVEL